MDPNACLKELRELGKHFENVPSLEDAYRMAELFDALDKWISKGGFLPKAWSRAKA